MEIRVTCGKAIYSFQMYLHYHVSFCIAKFCFYIYFCSLMVCVTEITCDKRIT